jgi:hypothetical protein
LFQPNREDEYARIEAQGGKVIQWNGYRVLGVLAMSRSIGTYPYPLDVVSATLVYDAINIPAFLQLMKKLRTTLSIVY